MKPEVKLKEIAELERRVKRLEEAVLLLAYAVLTEPTAPKFWYESPFAPAYAPLAQFWCNALPAS